MPPARASTGLNRLGWSLAALYAVDRLLKLWAANRFLQRPEPPAPQRWPSVTLLQPITHGASDLPGALACRAALRYAGKLQHILICDGNDAATLATCQSWADHHLHLEVIIIATRHRVSDKNPVSGAKIATKIEKLHAGLISASSDVLAFVDDDILLRPTAVEGLVRHLQQPRAGSAFGVAVYTNWRNFPSSLISAFVNANALLSYIPLTYLAEPFTITGHFYALPRPVFEAIGGLDGMGGRFDDDHELARRVQKHGLRNLQTPVFYDVDNDLATIYDYANQMQRWFVIPKQTMAPFLSPHQQAASLLGSSANLIPPLLALLTVAGRTSTLPLSAALGLFAAVYAFCERQFLDRRTPARRWPLLLLSALLAPLQAAAGLLGGNTFVWRGRRIRLHKGGQFEVLD
jgi:ceramide glucosyltransferase